MAPPRISEAESLVMQAIWASGPLGVEELLAQVAAPQGWGEATLRTLIHRLMKKKALASERQGARVVYKPLLARDDYLEGESQGLLDRLFGGKVSELVAHFGARQNLTPDDVARLKRLLAELDKEENR